jgi:uncharacterized protein
LVEYLALQPEPHLVAHECDACGARYFDRRNACAACSGRTFHDADVPTEGELVTFTIVSMAAPGVPVPFVAGVVDCGGTRVRGNVVGVEPDPAQVRTGMQLRLVTEVVGTDVEGTEAVGFAFEPAET